MYYAAYRARLRAEWRRLDAAEPPSAELPPAHLRFRVGEDSRAGVFRAVGQRTAENLKAAFIQCGVELQSGASVLDFGCGCGRTLLWLAREYPEVRWAGADVDAESVAWCRANIPGEFVANDPLPPLKFADASFDAIYAVSVFTHLSAEYQRAWLAELARVLRPGGWLLVSFHGRSVWAGREEAGQVESEGFAFNTSEKLSGILPAWYHTAFQARESVEEALRVAGFGEVMYLEGQLGAQDLACARRGDSSL